MLSGPRTPIHQVLGTWCIGTCDCLTYRKYSVAHQEYTKNEVLILTDLANVRRDKGIS